MVSVTVVAKKKYEFRLRDKSQLRVWAPSGDPFGARAAFWTTQCGLKEMAKTDKSSAIYLVIFGRKSCL